jgi:hypothetical protein
MCLNPFSSPTFSQFPDLINIGHAHANPKTAALQLSVDLSATVQASDGMSVIGH